MIYKVSVLNRPMGIQTTRLLTSLFIAVISVNFILYSSQRYSPPKAYSASYSIVNCPSHEGVKPLTLIVQFLTDTEEEGGSEKHCFCYSCCNPRAFSAITTQTAELSPDNNAGYYDVLKEITYTEKSYKNLPIRSPPSFIS